MKRLQHIKTIKALFLVFCLGLTTLGYAQDEYQEEDPGSEKDTKKNKASYKLGNGLNFSFNEGNYNFALTGFIQPAYSHQKADGLEDVNQFNSKRSFVQFEGAAVKEKVSFFIQLDYSLSDPLMDAYFSYQPLEQLKFSVGQRQTFVNNREMTYREDRLQFNDRSFLSQNLSQTGREFGIFIESKLNIGNVGIIPMVAVTSGDGRNSFGEDSRDSDIGGFKYGGRLDVYPLGYFKEGNDLTNVDLGREDAFKMVVGVAGSFNNGASGPVGESHGDFFLYDVEGNESLPDYRQLYVDVLMKYKGFSFLAEYANASGSGIDQVYLDESANEILAPGQISEFLALGDSYNFQLGYVTISGFSFDVRYESSTPEFDNNMNSILFDYNATTYGLTKYFFDNALKCQASYTTLNPDKGSTFNQFEILFQITL